MISKSNRLNRSEINNIKQFPLKYRDGGMLVLYQKNRLTYSKVAVVVSKKIHRKAVQRNYLKRIVMGTISQQLKKHPSLSFSLIFYPSKIYTQLSLQNKAKIMSNIFEYLCKKI